MAELRDKPRPLIVGRYELHGEIARGGMATVHVGRILSDAGFSRTVAIKRLHPHLVSDAGFAAMFVDEARLASRIHHPNVVPTLDVVLSDDELFLIMEYVQGESLSRLCRLSFAHGGHVPVEFVSAIGAGVLDGLHAAHEAVSEHDEPLGIVHRDVSPQNILVGIDGVPRIIDFGVAKAARRLQTTREGQLKGKLRYMPPEQFGGAPPDRRSDIYSTSIVLWEALTGQRLFDGESDAESVGRILRGASEPPSTYGKHIPRAMDDVIMCGLSTNPDHRFATAHTMAVALESAATPASARRMGEWVRAMAADSLNDRAKHILEIESKSSGVNVKSVLGEVEAAKGARTPEAPESQTASRTYVPRPAARKAPRSAPAQMYEGDTTIPRLDEEAEELSAADLEAAPTYTTTSKPRSAFARPVTPTSAFTPSGPGFAPEPTRPPASALPPVSPPLPPTPPPPRSLRSSVAAFAPVQSLSIPTPFTDPTPPPAPPPRKSSAPSFAAWGPTVDEAERGAVPAPVGPHPGGPPEPLPSVVVSSALEAPLPTFEEQVDTRTGDRATPVNPLTSVATPPHVPGLPVGRGSLASAPLFMEVPTVANRPPARLPASLTSPPMGAAWLEAWDGPAWTGTLRPISTGIVALFATFVVLVAGVVFSQLASFGMDGVIGLVIGLVVSGLVILWMVRSTYFRVDATGLTLESRPSGPTTQIASERIQRFAMIDEPDRKEMGVYSVHVVLAGGQLERLDIDFATEADAQWVMDRLNAALVQIRGVVSGPPSR